MSLLRVALLAASQASNSGGGGGDSPGTGTGIGIDGMTLPLTMNTYQLGEPTWEITYGVDITSPVPLPCDVELKLEFIEDSQADAPFHTTFITLSSMQNSWSFEFTFNNFALQPQEVYAAVSNIVLGGDTMGYRIIPSHIYCYGEYMLGTHSCTCPLLPYIYSTFSSYLLDNQESVPFTRLTPVNTQVNANWTWFYSAGDGAICIRDGSIYIYICEGSDYFEYYE